MTGEFTATGRAWVFPDHNINSDIILPGAWTQTQDRDEQARLLFTPYRPTWIDEVEPGDIVVAGKNFGTGSGRPAAALMKRVGVVAVVADSINDLFFRNCVNSALLPLECPGATGIVTEGDTIEVDAEAGRVTNLRTGRSLPAVAIPPLLLDIIAKGGLVARLQAGGYLL